MFPLVQHMYYFELILNCVINAEVCVLQPSDQVTDPEQETYGDSVRKCNETFDLNYKEPLLVELGEMPITLKPLGLSVTSRNKESN